MYISRFWCRSPYPRTVDPYSQLRAAIFEFIESTA